MSFCSFAISHVTGAHRFSHWGKWVMHWPIGFFFKDHIIFRTTLSSVLFSLLFQNSLLKSTKKASCYQPGLLLPSCLSKKALLRRSYCLQRFSQNSPSSIPSPFDLQPLFVLFLTFVCKIALLSLIAYWFSTHPSQFFSLSFVCLWFFIKVSWLSNIFQ